MPQVTSNKHYPVLSTLISIAHGKSSEVGGAWDFFSAISESRALRGDSGEVKGKSTILVDGPGTAEASLHRNTIPSPQQARAASLSTAGGGTAIGLMIGGAETI